LHGGGRVLRPDRDHRPRPDRGAGHPRGAEGVGRQGPGAAAPHGRPGGARRAAGPVGAGRGDARGRGDVLGRRRRGVRAPAVRRAGGADPVGQRGQALAGRRVPRLHRQHDPGRRGRLGDGLDAPHGAEERAMTANSLVGDVVRVTVPERSVAHDLRAIKIVLHRELIRYWHDRLRMVSGLVPPLLWLLVLGTGLSSLTTRGTPGVNLRTFMFAGVIALSVNFTALFSAASIVWDREFGFLREMLVAPVSRASIVIGKCLGGALV